MTIVVLSCKNEKIANELNTLAKNTGVQFSEVRRKEDFDNKTLFNVKYIKNLYTVTIGFTSYEQLTQFKKDCTSTVHDKFFDFDFIDIRTRFFGELT